MKKYILIASILFISFQPLTAQAQNEVIETKLMGDILVMFANGVNNTPAEMFDSLFVLQKQIEYQRSVRAVDTDSGFIIYDIQKNSTNGIPLDLLESLKLVVAQDGLLPILNFLLNGSDGYEGLSEEQKEIVRDKIIGFEKKVKQDIIQSDVLIQTYIPNYKAFLGEDFTNQIIVIAHSEGNLYANIIGDELSRENADFGRRFQVISVASPDTSIHGGWHITLVTDWIIKSIREIKNIFDLDPPLKANIDNRPDFEPGDLLGHNFIDNYMTKGSNSEKQISTIAFLGMASKARCNVGTISTYQGLYENCVFCGLAPHLHCTKHANEFFPQN